MIGFPAARVGDTHACVLCPAGPILPPGQVNVLVGGRPQARATDRMLCVPPLPTGSDVIVTGSFTVLVGNLPAARMFDLTLKPGVITTGQPNVLIGMIGLCFPSIVSALILFFARLAAKIAQFEGPQDDGEYAIFKNDYIKFVHLKVSGDAKTNSLFDWNFDGKVEFTLFEIAGAGTVELPLIGDVGAAGGFQAYKYEAAGQIGGTEAGFDVNAKGAASTLKATGAGFMGDDPANPRWEQGFGLGVGGAEASVNHTTGKGQANHGAGGGVKVSADAFSGEVYNVSNIHHSDGDTTRIFTKGGGGIGAGVEKAAYARENQATGRKEVGGSGAAGAGGKVQVTVDASHGPPLPKRPAFPTTSGAE